MNTDDIVNIVLELTNLDQLPCDSIIMNEGHNIKKILAGIDMGAQEIILGKMLGVDCIIGHHPSSDSAITNFHEILYLQKSKFSKYSIWGPEHK